MKKAIFLSYIFINFTLLSGEKEDFVHIKDLARNRFYTDLEKESKIFLNKYPKSQNHDQALYLLSLSYMMQKNYDKALSSFNKLDRTALKNDAFYQIVTIYLDTKNVTEAISVLKKMDKRNENTIEAYFKIGDYYYKSGDFKLARGFFEALLEEKNSKYNESLLRLGLISFSCEEYMEAISFMESYLLEEDRIDMVKRAAVLCKLADSYFQIGNYKDAIEYYLMVINLNNKNKDVYKFYVQACYGLISTYVKAKNEKELASSIQNLEKELFLNRDFAAILELATLLETINEGKEALLLYQYILKNKKDDKAMITESVRKSIKIYISFGRIKEAMDMLESLKDNISLEDYYYFKVSLLYVESKYETILNLVGEAEKQINEKSAYYEDMFTKIAWTYYNTGNSAKSYERFRYIYEKGFKKPQLLYGLMVSGAAIGKDEESEELFNIYLATKDKKYKKDVYFLMAELYAKNGKFESIEPLLKTLLNDKESSSNEKDDILYNLVSILLRLKRFEQIPKYIAMASSKEQKLLLEAVLQMNLHNYAKASECLLSLVDTDIDQANVYLYLIDCLIALNEYREAIKYADLYFSKNLNKNYEEVLDRKGVCYFKLKEYNSSLKVYKALADHSQEYRDYANYRIADNYYNLKDYDNARHYYLSAEPSSKYRKPSLYSLVNIYINQKDYPKALEFINKILLEFKENEYKDELLYYQVEIYLKTDRPEEAKKSYEELSKISESEKLKFATAKMNAYFTKVGNYDEAIKYAKKLNNPAQKAIQMALILEKKGNHEKARINYLKALTDPVEGDRACYLLASSYLKAKDYLNAELYLNKVIEKKTSKYRTQALFNKALMYEEQKNYKKAITVLNSLKVVFKDESLQEKVYIKLGENYEHLSDMNNALKVYKEFVDKFKGSEYIVVILDKIIDAELKKKNMASAQKYYKELTKIDAKAAEKYSDNISA